MSGSGQRRADIACGQAGGQAAGVGVSFFGTEYAYMAIRPRNGSKGSADA